MARAGMTRERLARIPTVTVADGGGQDLPLRPGDRAGLAALSAAGAGSIGRVPAPRRLERGRRQPSQHGNSRRLPATSYPPDIGLSTQLAHAALGLFTGHSGWRARHGSCVSAGGRGV